MTRPLFVAAVRQHVGKTTVSLALMNGLRKRFGKVGFIKPVGQQHVNVQHNGDTVRVDKDVQLMKEYFGLDDLDYPDMSPVLIPRNYTKRFIDGEITAETQATAIRESYARVAAVSDAVLFEGTGHVGVGSIVDMSNSQVAALVGADVVLVANGGLGSAFDDLELNRALLERHGVRVRGVVINKVLPEKEAMMRDYFGRLLEGRWGVPLLGVVPNLPLLAKPTLGDIEGVLGAELLGGRHCRSYHYSAESISLITSGVRRFLNRARQKQTSPGATRGSRTRPLFITHCTRDDIVLAFLAFHQKNQDARSSSWDDPSATEKWSGALILCRGGCTDANPQSEDQTTLPYLMQLVAAYNAPVMVTDLGAITAADRIHAHTAKLHIEDRKRVAAAIEWYEPRIDFDKLLAS